MTKLIRETIRELRERFPFATFKHSLPEPRPGNMAEAVARYQRERDFFILSDYVRLHYRADYRCAPAPLRLFVWKYMKALRSKKLPFYVHTCYRTPKEQAILHSKGHSKLLYGAHQRSAAVDIVCAIDHWDIPQPLWDYVGQIGKGIAAGTDWGKEVGTGEPLKIEWGGDWRSLYDPAHWQLSDWRRRLVTPDDMEPTRILPYSDRMRGFA